MAIPRRTLSVIAIVLCTVGLTQVVSATSASATSTARPAARHAANHEAKHVTAQKATAAAPKAIVCTATVALGSTTPCSFPAGGGTARYTFTSPGADIIRLRSAIPSGQISRQLTLRTSGGTTLCTDTSGLRTFDCALPSAGTYRVEVTVAQAATAYTSIDGVFADTCAPQPNLAVGSPGVPVDITQPGASYCAELTVNAPAHLQLVLDTLGDEGLDVTIYSGFPKAVCTLTQVTSFVRSDCVLTAANSFRLFASAIDDNPQDATLVVTKVSDPTGCTTGAPDAFGRTPSRRGTLPAHRSACYRFSGAAQQRVGVHLLGTTGTSSTLRWTVRSSDGSQQCAGGPTDAAVDSCLLPSAGQYALFVSTLARENVGYVVSLTDLGSAAGCAALPSTAWDASPTADTWAHTAEVDCRSFVVATGAAHPVVRAALYTDASVTSSATLVQADGTTVCVFTGRSDCTLPAPGAYRLIVSSTATGATAYRIQATDTSSAAGCATTTPDAMGSGPTRTVQLGPNLLQGCWTFTGPAGASYFVNSAGLGGDNLLTRSQVRGLDSSVICSDSFGPCTLPAAGTYLLVLFYGADRTVPAQAEDARVGLWRLDHPTSCATTGTAFTAAAVHGSIATPLELDCNQFGGAAGDRITVRSLPADYSVVQRVFAADGTYICFASNSDCTLSGPAPYRIVSYALGAQTHAYRFRVASVTKALGCSSLAILPFGSAPGRAFTIDDPVDVRCYRVQRTSTSGGRLAIRQVALTGADSSPVVRIYGPGGARTCTTFDELGTCTLPAGAGTYLLVLGVDDPDVSGTLGVYDYSTSTGCQPGPTGAFGTAATLARINGRGAVSCLTLPFAATDYTRVTFGPSAAGVRFESDLVDRTGFSYCQFQGVGGGTDCHLPANAQGPFRLLTHAAENASSWTGPYRIHAWRLNDPSGCTDIGSLRTGFGPLVGTLADPKDEACYLGQARTGTLSVTASNDDVPADVPVVQILRSSGNYLDCSVLDGSGNCTLLIGGTKTILVRTFDPGFTGHYRVSAACTSTHCGPATTTASRTAVPHAVVCSAAVALGSSTACAMPVGGGTAEYTFTVPVADTIRYRAAIPAADYDRTMKVYAGSTLVCSATGIGANDCAVPAGTYRLDVTTNAHVTVRTSVDTVSHASCGAAVDLTVGAAGVPVAIAAPGKSACQTITATPGDVLQFGLAAGDGALAVDAYDASGVNVCHVPFVSSYGRTYCAVTGGAAVRLFATPQDDITQTATLITTRLSDPDGCISRPLDTFGAAPNHRASLPAHGQRCYTFTAPQTNYLGVHLLRGNAPDFDVTWSIRSTNGTSICSGYADDDFDNALDACRVTAGEGYTLFVTSQADDAYSYNAGVYALAATAGCTPVADESWGAASSDVTFSAAAQVNCYAVTAGAGDRPILRITLDDDDSRATVVASSGRIICTIRNTDECRLPKTGAYRVLVYSDALTTRSLHYWVVDTSQTTGCEATIPDTMGTAPSRTAQLGGDVRAHCWTFTAPVGAAYFLHGGPLDNHDLYLTDELRSPTNGYRCTESTGNCTVPAAGTYVLVLQLGSVSSAEETGTGSVGAWRLDRPSGCPTVSTSFHAAAIDSDLSATLEVDCHQFTGTAGDLEFVHAVPFDYNPLHEIYDSSGAFVCFAFDSTCTLTGTGPYRVITYNFPTATDPTPSYHLRISSLTTQAGCSTLATTPFGSAPSRAIDESDPIEVRCYTVSRTVAGSLGVEIADVSPEDAFNVRVDVYSPSLQRICSLSAGFGTCATSAAGTYVIMVHTDRGLTGKIGVFDLTSSAGCVSGPSLAFGEAATPAEIAASGAVECLTVPFAAGDRGRINFGTSEANTVFAASVLDDSGQAVCSVESDFPEPSNCHLPSTLTGPARIVAVAYDFGGTALVGSFTLHAWRLNNPSGCTDIGSLHDGFGPLIGKLADSQDEACYVAQASAGTLAVTTSNDRVTTKIPTADLVRASGVVTCSVTGPGTCTLGHGQYAIIVHRKFAAPPFTGRYVVSGDCTSNRCGP